MNNHEWYLRFEGKRYPIEYRIYHLTHGDDNLTIHEIEYDGRTVTKSKLEDAVKQIGKLIRKRQ